MSDDSKEFMAWIDALAKGILAGCALGYLFSLTGMIPSAKAVVLGGLAGCLASITYKNRRDEKRNRDK
jgi:ABC-type Mn2+/Zn2+ transport system permease subunit